MRLRFTRLVTKNNSPIQVSTDGGLTYSDDISVADALKDGFRVGDDVDASKISIKIVGSGKVTDFKDGISYSVAITPDNVAEVSEGPAWKCINEYLIPLSGQYNGYDAPDWSEVYDVYMLGDMKSLQMLSLLQVYDYYFYDVLRPLCGFNGMDEKPRRLYSKIEGRSNMYVVYDVQNTFDGDGLYDGNEPCENHFDYLGGKTNYEYADCHSDDDEDDCKNKVSGYDTRWFYANGFALNVNTSGVQLKEGRYDLKFLFVLKNEVYGSEYSFNKITGISFVILNGNDSNGNMMYDAGRKANRMYQL